MIYEMYNTIYVYIYIWYMIKTMIYDTSYLIYKMYYTENIYHIWLLYMYIYINHYV